MIRILRCCLVILGCLLATPAAYAADAGTVVTLQFGGKTRSYVLYVPASYKPSVAVPLMLVEHGENGSGAQMEKTTHFDDVADSGGFIVAYPNSVGSTWVLGGTYNDIEFNEAVVSSIQASYRINAHRMYVSGFSDGGQMADAYACTRPRGQTVAGLAIVSNNLTAHAAQRCQDQPVIAYILFHGTADLFSPYDGNARQASAPKTAYLWADHDQCPGSPRSTILPDELSSGMATTDVKHEWMSCAQGRTVNFYTINGGGHNWPGAIQHVQDPVPETGPVSLDLDASATIWQTLSPFST